MDQSQVFRAMMPGLTSAGGARIAVAYPSFPRPLPLVRLDRRGLVFRAVGAAPLVCGLPRPATLLVADEPLCSLRLVIRDIAPAGDGRHDLTMQPSGAAGDELLWHALRDREPYRQIRHPLAPVDTPVASGGEPQAAAAETAARPSRSAAFRLPSHSDALSQQHGPQLQLNQLERQVDDDEVGVRFVYDIDGHATRHALTDCARQACTWIETEMRSKYALPVAQERFGAFAAHARAGGM
ncbi:hypothetical protein SIO83_003335 [Burkholderia cenocepacia]|nr:hypothetical protein [Burkholderia cenocepacia]